MGRLTDDDKYPVTTSLSGNEKMLTIEDDGRIISKIFLRNVLTYVRDNWKYPVETVNLTVSDTEPQNPNEGDIWVDTN